MGRITVPVQMRWADIDGYGHVNNAAMFTLLEEARVATFWNTSLAESDAPDAAADTTKVLTGGVGTDSHTLVARQEIEYLAPLTYTQEAVPIELWVGAIGGASMEVCYEVRDPAGTLCAKAATSLVMVDVAAGRPRRLTESERTALTALLDEPLTFRRPR